MDQKFEAQTILADVDVTVNPMLDDITAPAQYAAHVESESDESPEARLMLAMLRDAIDCVRKPKPSGAFRDAMAWIMEVSDDRLCSFENVCGALGLDPTYVRRGVLEGVASSASFPIPVVARTGRRRSIPIVVAA